tara:strand:+ start:2372 stop:2782 length:411 start_codon:yes stop_codon:yes gene_type:complete
MLTPNLLQAKNCYDKEKITVGLGATYHWWSDREPFTVIEVHKNWNGKKYDILKLQKDLPIPTKDYNYYGNQTHEGFKRDLDGKIVYLQSKEYDHPEHGKKTIYNHVEWNKITKRWRIVRKQPVSFGHRSSYTDPHF